MKNLKIRWRLHGDEVEPTTRQRGINVYRELQRQGYDADKWETGEAADIIVLQYGMRLLDEALSTGATVVQDVNDQVFAAHHKWHDAFRDNLHRVHAVVAGTERLAQHLRRKHPFVRVIQEPVDSRYFEVHKRRHDGLNILWCGMNDNYRYFSECDPALTELSKTRKFTVNIVCPPLDGEKKPNAPKVEGKPYPSKFWPWTMETLLKQMSLADIAVVPLTFEEWTANKAANKPLSFMAAGIPVVASDVVPYRHIITHGQNGYLCLDTHDWMHSLECQLTDSNLRGSISCAGRITANHFRVERIAEDWVRLFEEIRPK